VKWYKRRGVKIECVQTDNGPEFTTRFIQGLMEKLNAAIVKITTSSIPATAFLPVMTLTSS